MGINVRINMSIQVIPDYEYKKEGKLYTNNYIELPIEIFDIQKLSEFIYRNVKEITNELQTES